MKKILIFALFSLILLFSISFTAAQDIEGVNFDDTISVDEVSELEISEDDNIIPGNTIYISPDGSGDGLSESNPTNWENAYNKANSGDTIQFANGTYYNIKATVVNNINLKGSGNTIIDAQGDDGFFSTYGSVTLTDLTFINAYTGEKQGNPDGPKTGYSGEGAIVNNGYLTVKDCTFRNNTGIGTEGGAIHNSKTCYIHDSTFFGNGGKKGGAIYSDKNSNLYIYNSIIQRCVSKEGSALHAKEAYVEIHNCTVRDSSAKNGLFYIKKSTVKFHNSNFYNSRAVDAAGVINIDKESSVEIDNCIFDRISSTGTKLWFHDEYGSGDGGVIAVEEAGNNIVIKNSVFTNCSAKGYGGVIYLSKLTSVTIDNCTFKDNSAKYGDNIYSISQGLTIKNSNFEVKSTIKTSDIANGQTEVINITVDDGTNGLLNPTYSIYVNKQIYQVRDNSLSLYKLNPGIYNATLMAQDSNGNNYSFTQDSSVFVIGDQEIEVKVDYAINDDGTINIAVIDEFNRPVANNEVTVNIDGLNYTATTDSNGIATIKASLESGEHNISINVDGKKVSPSTPSTINVSSNDTSKSDSSIIADDLKRAYGSPYDFKALLLDKNGNPLKNKNVNFIINGNDHEIQTDEFGYAYLKNTLMSGNYQVTIENPATGEKLTRSVEITPRFMGNDVVIDYTYSGTYRVQVYADNGQVAGAGESVVITINGISKTVKTNAKGYATFKVSNLLPKTYSITAEYKGVKTSNKVVVKQILKAKNKKFKRYKAKKYTATLKTSAGKAIKGKKITFKIKGKTYKAKTNKKGVATIKIRGLYKIGKYKITIKYLKTSIKKTITIKR